jgi:hypothetical protein
MCVLSLTGGRFQDILDDNRLHFCRPCPSREHPSLRASSPHASGAIWEEYTLPALTLSLCTFCHVVSGEVHTWEAGLGAKSTGANGSVMLWLTSTLVPTVQQYSALDADPPGPQLAGQLSRWESSPQAVCYGMKFYCTPESLCRSSCRVNFV